MESRTVNSPEEFVQYYAWTSLQTNWIRLLGVGRGRVSLASVGFESSPDVSNGQPELRSTGLEPRSSDFSSVGFLLVL